MPAMLRARPTTLTHVPDLLYCPAGPARPLYQSAKRIGSTSALVSLKSQWAEGSVAWTLHTTALLCGMKS